MKLINIQLNKQVEEAASESKTQPKGGKRDVVDYLKHLGMLSVALGCAITANAAPASATAAQAATVAAISLPAGASHSSLDRVLAQAEASKGGEFAINLPWYFRSWPESTWRQWPQNIGNAVNGSQLDRAVAPQPAIDSFAGLLEEVSNEG